MPMDDASMAQAANPASTKPRNAACSVTGSGVVSPVDATAPGSPTPSVPTTAQRWPSRVSAWASHHVVDVLPFVPVLASMRRRWLGWP